MTNQSCPCSYEEVEPCKPTCTCANPVMSGGCLRCCTYGSLEQRITQAKRLSKGEKSIFKSTCDASYSRHKYLDKRTF